MFNGPMGHLYPMPFPGPRADPRVRNATTVVFVWTSLTPPWFVFIALFWTTWVSDGNDEDGRQGLREILLAGVVIGVAMAFTVVLTIATRWKPGQAMRLSLAITMIVQTIGHVLSCFITGAVLILFLDMTLFEVMFPSLFPGSMDGYLPAIGYLVLALVLDGVLITLGVLAAVRLFHARPKPAGQPSFQQ